MAVPPDFDSLVDDAEAVVSAAQGAVSGAEAPFELRVGSLSPGDLVVRTVHGREGMSACFRFDVEFASTLDPETLVTLLLGQPTSLVIHRAEGSSRVVQGIPAALRERGAPIGDARLFHLRLVPQLALLRRRRNSRIFQNKTVVEVVTAILKEAGVQNRWAVTARYPSLVYCVQYAETDYEFITRLLREAGIFFFFEPPTSSDDPSSDAATQETVVFADAASAYTPIEAGPTSGASVLEAAVDTVVGNGAGSSPFLIFRAREGHPTTDDGYVTAFDIERVVKSKTTTIMDYDFRRPLLRLTAAAHVPPDEGSAVAEVAAGGVSPAGGSAGSSKQPDLFEVYEHHGQHEDPDVSSNRAKALLEALRASAIRANGASICRRLAPGFRFTLEDHPDSALNQEYVVVTLTHEGHVPTTLVDGLGAAAGERAKPTYTNTFVCAPSAVPLRPPPKPRRLQECAELAIVTGPAGEDIYTDEFGRIRVQFPWDRDGKYDDHSSCWIRVSQQWAGPSWGAQFIPRIGMEVIVSFLGGDVDRPVVTGCLNNATHPTTFWLPKDKTRSGWRTQTSPGGAGFNELSFEDSAGKEQILLKAQRNFDETVGHDHMVKVEHDEKIVVAHDQSITVKNDRTAITLGNETVSVAKDQSIHVGGSRADVIGGSSDVTIADDLTLIVKGGERREFAEATNALFADDRMETVRGSYTTLVGKKSAQRAYVLHVEGTAQIGGTTGSEIRSDTAIVLQCGTSSIRLTPTGIEINASSVSLVGSGAGLSVSDKLDVRTKGNAQLVADKILFKTQQSSIALSTQVQIDGTKILLKSPASATDPVTDTSPPPTNVELVDANGKPLPNQRFLITLGDGSVRSGMTDKDGKAELMLDGPGTIVFPDVTDATAG